MRVLTVRQPWAWAIVHGGKDVENRGRNLAGAYRGPVAIHAGLRDDPTGYYDPTLDNLDPAVLVRGAILGVVDLVGVHEQLGGYFEIGPRCCTSRWAQDHSPFHLELANPRPLATPIPFRGGLGLRRLDEATEFAIHADLDRQTWPDVRTSVTREVGRRGKSQGSDTSEGRVVALLKHRVRVRWTSKNGVQHSPFVSDHRPNELTTEGAAA